MSFRSTQGFQITDLLISLKFHKIYICLFIPWIIISKLRDIIWWVVMATSVLELSRHQINSNSLMMSTKSPPPSLFSSMLSFSLPSFTLFCCFSLLFVYLSFTLSQCLLVFSFIFSSSFSLSLSRLTYPVLITTFTLYLAFSLSLLFPCLSFSPFLVPIHLFTSVLSPSLSAFLPSIHLLSPSPLSVCLARTAFRYCAYCWNMTFLAQTDAIQH